MVKYLGGNKGKIDKQFKGCLLTIILKIIFIFKNKNRKTCLRIENIK